MPEPQDPVVGKIVIDFSRKYVSIYLCEGDGTIKDFDHVRWPIRLDLKDARTECLDIFHRVYQWALDDIVAWDTRLQGGGEGGSQSA